MQKRKNFCQTFYKKFVRRLRTYLLTYKVRAGSAFENVPLVTFLESNYGVSLSGPLNKNMTSFMDKLNNIIVNLSIPIPKPPCGGHPYSKNFR